MFNRTKVYLRTKNVFKPVFKYGLKITFMYSALFIIMLCIFNFFFKNNPQTTNKNN